jgi:hypothetical protein
MCRLAASVLLSEDDVGDKVAIDYTDEGPEKKQAF